MAAVEWHQLGLLRARPAGGLSASVPAVLDNQGGVTPPVLLLHAQYVSLHCPTSSRYSVLLFSLFTCSSTALCPFPDFAHALHCAVMHLHVKHVKQ